jgi:hypothetical protein
MKGIAARGELPLFGLIRFAIIPLSRYLPKTAKETQ